MSQARPGLNRRRAARFAAVQALYQIDLADTRPETVIAEFGEHRLARLLEPFAPEAPQPPVDVPWFRLLVEGTSRARPRLDPVLERCLVEGWSLARCGYLLRATLRAGAFELLERTDVPVAVVINEYVEVAKLFLAGAEPSFVNAVLDKAASELRGADVTVES